jgi:plastocyanin
MKSGLTRGFYTIGTTVWLAAMLAAAPLSSTAEELYQVSLTAKDGRFHPEVLEVPAGQRFKVVIKNEGPGPEEFESANPHREKVLTAGATSFVIFPALKPGVYPFFGEFHPETAKGRIVVK